MTDIIIIPALKKMRTAISKKIFRPLTSTYIFRGPIAYMMFRWKYGNEKKNIILNVSEEKKLLKR